MTLDHNLTDNDRVSVKYRHWRPNREATTGTFGISSNWNHFRGQYAQKEDAVTVNYTKIMTAAAGQRDVVRLSQHAGGRAGRQLPDPISKVQREPNGLGTLGSAL